jgi:hypothetical protein
MGQLYAFPTAANQAGHRAVTRRSGATVGNASVSAPTIASGGMGILCCVHPLSPSPTIRLRDRAHEGLLARILPTYNPRR